MRNLSHSSTNRESRYKKTQMLLIKF